MSQPVNLNKLVTHDEFNTLYHFLNKYIDDFDSSLNDETANNIYENAKNIVGLAELINLDNIEDDVNISISIVSTDSEEDLTNITDIDEIKSKVKEEQFYSKEQYKKLLEEAKNLIDEIEIEKIEAKIIKNIIKKITPIYDFYEKEKW